MISTKIVDLSFFLLDSYIILSFFVVEMYILCEISLFKKNHFIVLYQLCFLIVLVLLWMAQESKRDVERWIQLSSSTYSVVYSSKTHPTSQKFSQMFLPQILLHILLFASPFYEIYFIFIP